MLIVPIVTTRACKANFYWSGPSSSIKVYAPTITTLENAVPANKYGNMQMENITVRITT